MPSMQTERTSSPGELVPWQVDQAHRWSYALLMLRTEARRRAGLAVSHSMGQRLDRWLLSRTEEDSVVHYDPATEEGFCYVPRRPGVDADLVRVPEK